MGSSGSDPNSRIDTLHQIINQLKQEIARLENRHSRSASQAIRPIQTEVDRHKDQLKRA